MMFSMPLTYKQNWALEKAKYTSGQSTAYVSRHYMNESIVIFDGYPTGLTTKYSPLGEMRKDVGVGPNVLVTSNTKLSVREKVFKKPEQD